MRTTINIDNDLLGEIKQIALKKQVPLGDIVDDALRGYLVEREEPLQDFDWAEVAVEVAGARGVRPGTNWRSNSALLELVEDA